MNMRSHTIWMIIGLVLVLVMAKFIGASAFLLFFLLCCLMMVVMMLSMGKDSNDKPGGHSHEDKKP